MRSPRPLILASLAALCGLCLFSYAADLESGQNVPILLVVAAIALVICVILSRKWKDNSKS